ncbi:MAG: hypothetical protein H8M99_01510 [Gloeobacteraceae cyanobacterium ES-bin-144]|nr:hypothetical protein [Verrucomicrobiales bacterium]
MKTKKNESPPWWDDSKLRKAYFADGYSGWVIDCGDGTCRYANAPLLGADPGEQEDGSVLTQEECDAINAYAPKWGDRVKWKDGRPDPTQIVERWEPERYDPKTGAILEHNAKRLAHADENLNHTEK